MVDAKIMEMVMTFDEHKQKIRNEIDMQRNMAALFDAMLEDATNKLDKLNRKAQVAERNVYGLELEVAICRRHFTFLETFMQKVKKDAITTFASPIAIMYIYIFQHDFISMGWLLTSNQI